MPINFAAICPHPPVLIPQIGKEQSKKVEKTRLAMEKLALICKKKKPKTLIVISPHGLVYPDRINLCGMSPLYGNFSFFGAPEISFWFENNLPLASEIDQKANQQGLNTLLYHNGQNFYVLDHGTLVPLFFLSKTLNPKTKIVPITYSFQDRLTHFKFGQLIELISKKTSSIGLIASGDLSHRLPNAGSNANPFGQEFDEKLIEALKNRKTREVLSFDEELVEEASECGYRSILILLGALSGKKYKTEVLSYEAPFGVGYLVANFQFK